jgi:hypothetical protein
MLEGMTVGIWMPLGNGNGSWKGGVLPPSTITGPGVGAPASTGPVPPEGRFVVGRAVLTGGLPPLLG